MSDQATKRFFSSRWVDVPDSVREDPAGGLPGGFRAAGVAAGIKPSGGKDVALLVCDAPGTTSAARFTRSGVLAAPVLVTQERCNLEAIRAVVANSGNANAATGGRGLDDAAKMQGAGAMAAGVHEDRVAVASTGVIGVPMPMDGVPRAVLAARAALEVELSGGTVRLCAQAKGAGMIQPSFATLLCFVQTDAVLSAETADLLLGVCVKRSFDRISVDGQLSTNDTVILMCSGASGVAVEPESEAELVFGHALDALLRQLALSMVRDGEGAKRVGRVVVRGGHLASVEEVARAVANSPLVKVALLGGDPNWGRIVQSVGMALPETAPLPVDVTIEGVRVCARGAAVPFDKPDLVERVAGDEIEYVVDLPGDGAETEVFFSDLSHDYVTINAEYTT